MQSHAFPRHASPTAWHAPILVRHALAGLPDALPGVFGEPNALLPYVGDGEPVGPFDRLLRSAGAFGGGASGALITSHFASAHGREEQARIQRVPVEAGADWRDIDNSRPVRALPQVTYGSSPTHTRSRLSSLSSGVCSQPSRPPDGLRGSVVGC